MWGQYAIISRIRLLLVLVIVEAALSTNDRGVISCSWGRIDVIKFDQTWGVVLHAVQVLGGKSIGYFHWVAGQVTQWQSTVTSTWPQGLILQVLELFLCSAPDLLSYLQLTLNSLLFVLTFLFLSCSISLVVLCTLLQSFILFRWFIFILLRLWLLLMGWMVSCLWSFATRTVLLLLLFMNFIIRVDNLLWIVAFLAKSE